jgi:hypothetical protein
MRLPRVLMDERRPTLPPTPWSEEVITLTTNGQVMARSERGTKKSMAEASKAPVAR